MNVLRERIWLVYTTLAALSWSVWGTLTKYVSGEVNPYTYQILFTAGMLFSLPFVIYRCKKKDVNLKGIVWGTSTGLLAVIGNISVYQSFKMGGQASVVIPFTNLYSLVTILIALLIFKEKIRLINGIGILIVVPAIIILSGQSQLFTGPGLFFQHMKPEIWVLFAFLALFLFGLFSATQKLTANFIPTEWSYLSFIASSVLISVGFILSGLVEFKFSTQTFWVGSLAGLVDGLGVLFVYAAYRAGGKASQVSPVVATLQQLFTIGLALSLLKEKLSMVEFAGIGLAVIGSWFLLSDKKVIPIRPLDFKLLN
ncbi:integral membrane protein [Aquipluma nitroreducens]|uniref:Integral membrane protein n=1 Tax=Aquipluma nitroreducens TaxID=2010828 RepID=A0A5K7S3Q1_9BACT|nr:DMT family transporter [Aquipluma nitroreducens]BBE16173.1 integral membrane protein [Aquipluma nitroreducens]